MLHFPQILAVFLYYFPRFHTSLKTYGQGGPMNLSAFFKMKFEILLKKKMGWANNEFWGN